MQFLIKSLVGEIPDLKYGAVGSELECFIPIGMKWRQLNYGQGEGQIEIGGCEWGFYYSDKGSISVILHSGSVDIDIALAFVRGVASRIYGAESIVEIAGTNAQL